MFVKINDIIKNGGSRLNNAKLAADGFLKTINTVPKVINIKV